MTMTVTMYLLLLGCLGLLVNLSLVCSKYEPLSSTFHKDIALRHSNMADELELNNSPIIGVLAQEVVGWRLQHGDSYFMSSYVSLLEMAGARVVPIRVDEDTEYYTTLFKKINGVLFPGGSVDILTSKYAKAAKILFNLAKQANDAGDRFPLYGVCLGHELLTALVTGRNILKKCDAENLVLPITLTPDGLHSRMLGSAPSDIIKVMTSYNVTANLHKECLTPENFTKYGLDKFFHILSTNNDREGTVFVSTMEAREYPFYSTQWHPEKNAFTWDTTIPLNHSRGAVSITQYIGNFIVGEARHSMHKYPDMKSLGAALIQNYQPVYTSAPKFYLDYYFNFTHPA